MRLARVALQIEGCICFDKRPLMHLDKHHQVPVELESLSRIVESGDRWIDVWFTKSLKRSADRIVLNIHSIWKKAFVIPIL